MSPFPFSTPSPTSSSVTHINPNPDSEMTLPPADSDSDNPRGMMRIRRHLTAEIDPRRADVVLLVCCVLSGLVDSTIYNGNTIFIGLGASSSPSSNTKPYGWVKSLTSVICFTLGAFFFSRLCRLLHPLRRSTLATSFFIQALFIIVATALFQSGAISGTIPTLLASSASPDIDWKSLAPIVLLSFQAAGQLIGSRVLELNEIPTVVVTSMLCDFAADPLLFTPVTANVKRNRRLLAFLGILVGAMAGGWISKARGEVQTALWIAAGVKVVIAVSWTVWPGQS